jgi:hypothetical protein
MFNVLYQGHDLGYHYIEETGDFMLSTKKYKIRVTLTGKDAVLLKQHLETVTSEQDAILSNRIEKVISIHLYMYICEALNKKPN